MFSSSTLVDQTGRTVTDAAFRGEYLLVYFGYTHCTDLCPLALVSLSSAIRDLGPARSRVRPLFITVDPKRDTVERLADYVRAFNPRLVGLAGTRSQIRQAAEGYGVDYLVGVVGGEYLVHHSNFAYLVGPDGHILGRFPADAEPGAIADIVRAEMAAADESS